MTDDLIEPEMEVLGFMVYRKCQDLRSKACMKLYGTKITDKAYHDARRKAFLKSRKISDPAKAYKVFCDGIEKWWDEVLEEGRPEARQAALAAIPLN
jgi:hypothetical protein